ncbi:MAG: hypothetical protein ACE5HP_12215 [Gemmatimonadota bacterium]
MSARRKKPAEREDLPEFRAEDDERGFWAAERVARERYRKAG